MALGDRLPIPTNPMSASQPNKWSHTQLHWWNWGSLLGCIRQQISPASNQIVEFWWQGQKQDILASDKSNVYYFPLKKWSFVVNYYFRFELEHIQLLDWPLTSTQIQQHPSSNPSSFTWFLHQPSFNSIQVTTKGWFQLKTGPSTTLVQAAPPWFKQKTPSHHRSLSAAATPITKESKI